MAQPIYAVGILFEDSLGNILVLRRQPGNPEGGAWGLVGGKIVNGATPATTAVTKVASEIGYMLDPARLHFLRTYNWGDLNIVFELFKVGVKTRPQVALDLQASSAFAWMRPQELYTHSDLMQGLYFVLEDIYKTRSV